MPLYNEENPWTIIPETNNKGTWQMETPIRKRQQRFSIELELLAPLSKLADDQEISISILINDAIRNYLKDQ